MREHSFSLHVFNRFVEGVFLSGFVFQAAFCTHFGGCSGYPGLNCAVVCAKLATAILGIPIAAYFSEPAFGRRPAMIFVDFRVPVGLRLGSIERRYESLGAQSWF